MALTLAAADLRACYSYNLDKWISDLTVNLGRAPGRDEPIPAEIWWALPSASMHDAVWSLRVAEPADEARATAVRVAVTAARTVEHLLPVNERAVCVAAIQAAEDWLKEPTPERLAKVEAARIAARAACATAATVGAVAYAATSTAYNAVDAAWKAAGVHVPATAAINATTNAAVNAVNYAGDAAYIAGNHTLVEAAIRAVLVS